MILINPPSAIYHSGYSYVDYATMSGKLIFFKGMLIHISENNNDFIFGYSVVPNKTHLEYKLLQNSEHQFQICHVGTNDHTCANPIIHYPYGLWKNPNDLLYSLAIPHYS